MSISFNQTFLNKGMLSNHIYIYMYIYTEKETRKNYLKFPDDQ